MEDPRYRRGKSLNNDMDIVFSYPDQEQGADIIKGLCQKLIFHLHTQGQIEDHFLEKSS